MPRYDWSSVDHLLGRVTDADIARVLACTDVAVGNRRRRLGIAPAVPPRSGHPSTIDWSAVADFGIATDSEIAWRMRCSRETVRRARLRRAVEMADHGGDVDGDPIDEEV